MGLTDYAKIYDLLKKLGNVRIICVSEKNCNHYEKKTKRCARKPN